MNFFQYNSRDLVYLISPLTSQLRTAVKKDYGEICWTPGRYMKIIDPHNYLLIILNGKLLCGLFEHKRIKPVVIRTSEGNVTNLAHIK